MVHGFTNAEEQQADPEVAVDPNRSREVAQKLAELEPVVAAYRAGAGSATPLASRSTHSGRSGRAAIAVTVSTRSSLSTGWRPR